MSIVLKWLLWLWIAVAIIAAFKYAPVAAGFKQESSRILFFHVPMAWTGFLAFLAAGIWSLTYLFFGRRPKHDRAAAVAVELGLVFSVLATVTGSIWSRIEWGAFWNWDPRQSTIVLTLLFYGAYLVLRGAVTDPDLRARLSAAYAVLGLVVAPFLFWVVPRITFSLHPDAVVNTRGTVEMDPRIFQTLALSAVGFVILFFWLHNLRSRLQVLREGKELSPQTVRG